MNTTMRLLCATFFTLQASYFTSCSEEDDTVDEYANWQQRNDAFFATLDDSLQADPDGWLRLKCYSLSDDIEGTPGDYVYAKIINSASPDETDSPMLSDSVRVSYQGRLIPTDSHPDGYVFDGTAYDTYNSQTNATVKWAMVSSSGYEQLVTGWITALLHMHRGDYWRVYVPYQQAYGSTDKSSDGIPAYSTLIFDLTLVDFSPAGHAMPTYSARTR